MAEVLLAGGVTIDVATKKDVAAHHDRLAALLERPHARFHRYSGGGPPRATNLPTVIRLDTPKPPAGWMWLLQWVAITGDDPTVSAAIANVRAALFVGARPNDAAIPNPPASGLDYAGCILPGISVPTPNAITIPDKNVVYTEEEVYAVLAGTGLVAGAAFYHLLVGVVEIPQRPDALMW